MCFVIAKNEAISPSISAPIVFVFIVDIVSLDRFGPRNDIIKNI